MEKDRYVPPHDRPCPKEPVGPEGSRAEETIVKIDNKDEGSDKFQWTCLSPLKPTRKIAELALTSTFMPIPWGEVPFKDVLVSDPEGAMYDEIVVEDKSERETEKVIIQTALKRSLLETSEVWSNGVTLGSTKRHAAVLSIDATFEASPPENQDVDAPQTYLVKWTLYLSLPVLSFDLH
ncbi:hypothetical protein MTR67_017542 [Solanum verrucosum]|uniref:Uncharacterized protein n=1 Tax=Solanum verrucosum TaxID=315347 RepID=A0AAF0TKV1_SOLVR|nr:hypothetical protein MTR67_017542 [Solanum verrucosum]